MNTPVPPTPPSNAQLQVLHASSGITGAIVQSALPQNALQSGQALFGTVLNRLAAGQFLIQTDAGKLTLQTAGNLLNGSTISMQVQNAGTRPLVLVVSLPGQGRNAPSPTSNSQPVITSTLTQGSTVSAAVTRLMQTATTPNPGTIPPNVGLTSGASGAIETTSHEPTIKGVARKHITTSQVSSSGTAALASSSTASTTRVPQISPALSAGMTFTVRILSVTPPGPATTQASQTTGPSILTGTVTGTNPSGQTVVQTNRGEIVLNSRSALPHGTQLGMQFASTPLAPIEAGDEPFLLLNRQWEALRSAIVALQAGDPAAAHNLTQQVLPQAGGPLTTGILFFLSAMMTGDLRRWMGEDAIRALQRTGNNLLERLGRDIGEMQRMASEPSGQEWRSYLIPILVGTELQQLKLFVRGEKGNGEDEADNKKRDTRFVIEVEFSNLGPFQFDGLTRDRNIDVMIRTRDPLAENLRDNIRAIFSNSVSALGFTGTLNFQRSVTFELNPTKEVHDRQGGLTI